MTNNKRKRSPWRLFFRVVKPYWGHLILAAVFVLLAAICVYLAPFVTSFTLDYVIRGVDPHIPEHFETYTTDGLHFNDVGHALIAEKLAELIVSM